jgi:hypothetical protein
MSSAALRSEALSATSLGWAGSPGPLEFLLAACALSNQEVGQPGIQQLRAQEVDWSKVIALARVHGLTPILYCRLSGCTDLVPDATWRELRANYERNARQALHLTHLLYEILDCFESQGIEALPCKGPVLAETLYQNVALRQFSDLDILVRPGDVLRAKAALEKLGYTSALALTSAQHKAYLDSGYEYSFDKGDVKSVVELQWRILPRFYAVDFDTKNLLARSTYATVAGKRVRTLRAENLFLVLCVHAAKHVWERLAWTRDVAELVDSQVVDWNHVTREAQRLGVGRIVGITLALARDLFGARIPPAMEPVLTGDRAIVPLAAQIRQGILSARESDTESVGYFRLMLRLRERWLDRMAFIARLTFTPSVGEWSSVRLPSPLFPLYRVVRMGRLLRRLTGRLDA